MKNILPIELISSSASTIFGSLYSMTAHILPPSCNNRLRDDYGGELYIRICCLF